MNDYVYILEPTAPAQEQRRARVTGLASLQGKVVGFIDNAKPNFNHLADDIGELLVMRNGSAVEHGPVGQVLSNPSQDYTRELLAAVPRITTSAGAATGSS